jgi:hypothetical protein
LCPRSVLLGPAKPRGRVVSLTLKGFLFYRLVKALTRLGRPRKVFQSEVTPLGQFVYCRKLKGLFEGISGHEPGRSFVQCAIFAEKGCDFAALKVRGV